MSDLLGGLVAKWRGEASDGGHTRIVANVYAECAADLESAIADMGLQEMPARMDDSIEPFPVGEPDFDDGYASGWNACLDAIAAQKEPK